MSQLRRQFLSLSAARVVAAVLQAVALLLVAREVAVSDFGYLASVLGLATFAQTLLDCGVPTLVIRERASRPDSELVTAALRFTALSNLVLCAVLLCALSVAGMMIDPSYYSLLPLAFWAAGERLADARLSVVLADGDVHVNAINLVARRGAGILLFVLMVVGGLGGLLAYSMGTAVAATGSAFFAALYVRRRLPVLTRFDLRLLLREARPYWVHSVATQARNLDAALVGALSGGYQAGLYSSGSRLTNPLRILPASLATVLLPASARRLGDNSALRRTLRLAVLATLAMSALYLSLVALAPWGVRVALGPAYESAVAVIQIVLLGLPFAALSSLLAAVLQGCGRASDVASSSLVSTAFALIGVAFAATQGGAIWAAAALSTSFVVQSGLLVRVVVRVHRVGFAESS